MADIVALRKRATASHARWQEIIGDPTAGSLALAQLVRTADDLTGPGRVLPVLPELRSLLPGGGLRRGATVCVAPGGTSLVLALLSAASKAGSWCAVVGVPSLGAVAAAEIGIDLGRLALVPNPGPEWTAVVAALIDGVDIVVAAPSGPIAPTVTSRLAARARQRGSVLVPYGRWEGADVTLEAIRGVWHGLGQGHGRLHSRQLTIAARGRGAAVRPKQAQVWLPTPAGTVAEVPDTGFGQTSRRPPLTVLAGAV